jgi:phosphatidylglycerophosphate synthase
MTYKEVYAKCVTENKRMSDKLMPWLHYIVRPLSIWITIPLLKTNVKPNMVTAWSMIATLIGFVLVSFGEIPLKAVGVFFYFIWAVLDCVDGNIARCKKMFSTRGELWDAAGGYLALSLLFMSAGIAAFNETDAIPLYEGYWNIILGGLTSVLAIYPRLIMQKKIAINDVSEALTQVKTKQEYSWPKRIVLNFESAIGFVQLLLLLCILFHYLNYFVILYFLLNVAMATYSFYLLLIKV